jgi:hypothetical protein
MRFKYQLNLNIENVDERTRSVYNVIFCTPMNPNFFKREMSEKDILNISTLEMEEIEKVWQTNGFQINPLGLHSAKLPTDIVVLMLLIKLICIFLG